MSSEKTIPQRLNELEAHIKLLEVRMQALEDLEQSIARIILGPPIKVASPTSQPKPEAKDYFRTNKLTVWQPFPETEKNQGRWEKNTQFNEPQYQEIVKALEAAGKQLHSTDPNALYWILKDLETDKVTGIGRRRDEWRKH